MNAIFLALLALMSGYGEPYAQIAAPMNAPGSAPFFASGNRSPATPFYGLSFGGDDYAVTTANPTSGATALTVCGWVYKRAAGAGNQHPWCVGITGNALLWGYDLGRVHCNVSAASSVYIGASGTADYTSKWVWIAERWGKDVDGGKPELRVYRADNGLTVMDTAATGFTGTLGSTIDTMLIGCSATATPYAANLIRYWNGDLVALRFWNRRLSDAEIIAEQYALKPNPTGLVAAYNEPGSGQVWQDGDAGTYNAAFGAGGAAPAWMGPYTKLTTSGPTP